MFDDLIEDPDNVETAEAAVGAIEAAENVLAVVWGEGFRTWADVGQRCREALGDELALPYLPTLRATWLIRFQPLIDDGLFDSPQDSPPQR